MKLQDIFNIKTNTGGGNKLFTRIMNRYNVPKKEYIKVKDELENFSGGGDSGSSDVEYWKLNLSKIAEDQVDTDVFFPYMVSIMRFEDNFIMPYMAGINMGKTIDINKPYVAFIPVNFGKWYSSLKDIFVEAELNPDDYFTPITKEEFYDLNSSDNSGESTVKEGDLIYYTLNDSFTSIGNITDNITQIAVGRGESMNSGSIGNLNRFVDIQDVTINKGESYVSISIPNFIVVDMPAFVYKVGSDLKTAEDIIGNSSITRITKEEYDNIFNM